MTILQKTYQGIWFSICFILVGILMLIALPIIALIAKLVEGILFLVDLVLGTSFHIDWMEGGD